MGWFAHRILNALHQNMIPYLVPGEETEFYSVNTDYCYMGFFRWGSLQASGNIDIVAVKE